MTLEAVQEELGLGPNGGLLYCIDYLEKNLDWLEERLAPLEEGESEKGGREHTHDYQGEAGLAT